MITRQAFVSHWSICRICLLTQGGIVWDEDFLSLRNSGLKSVVRWARSSGLWYGNTFVFYQPTNFKHKWSLYVVMMDELQDRQTKTLFHYLVVTVWDLKPLIFLFFFFIIYFRRNNAGDREKALQVMLQVLQTCDHPAPDMFCLCGRIYKDMFLDSDCKDVNSRDHAIEW